MVEIKDVKITPNPCKDGEQILISVEVEYFLTYPYGYPYSYGKSKND